MVKGISRQVIVVRSPDPKLFDQAIFILKDGAVSQGITDEELLRQAGAAVRPESKKNWLRRAFWACAGAGITAAVWVGTCFL